MVVGEQCLPIGIGEARTVKQRHHGLAQRFPARELGVGGLAGEHVGDKLPRRSRMNRPVGDWCISLFISLLAPHCSLLANTFAPWDTSISMTMLLKLREGLALAFVVAGVSGIAVFIAESAPDPMNAMALAPVEAVRSAIRATAGTAEPQAAEAALVQQPPKALGSKPPCQENNAKNLGGDCTPGKAQKPRSVQAGNEQPAITAAPIGHRDGPALLPSEPAIPVAATPDGLDGSAKPADPKPDTDAAPALAVVESTTPAASAKKARTRSSHVQRRDRNAYSRSPSYSYHNYYQSGYARVW
jgi:hypothetical protein